MSVVSEEAPVLVVDPQAQVGDPMVGPLAAAVELAGGKPHLLACVDLLDKGSLQVGPLIPAVVVIGPNVAQPSLLGRRLHQNYPSAHLVFVAHPEDESRLRRQLSYGAPPSSQWILVRHDSSDLISSLGDTLQSALKAQQLRARLDRINLQLAATTPVEQKNYQMLLVSERYLTAILAHARDGIVSLDKRGVVQTWNQGAEQLLGVAANDAIGRPFGSLAAWPPDVPEVLAQAAAGTASRHEWQLDLPQRRVHLEAVVSPVRDESGRTFGVAAIMRDVGTVRQLVDSLQDMDRRKDEFLAMLAHELRNPLAPIVNGTRVLHRSENLSATGRRTLEMMDRQLRQLTRLVDDLLEVNRISRGKIELRVELVNLRTVLRSAVESVMPMIEQRGQQLTVVVLAEPVTIAADPARLVQVLENLLNNASKYTPEGGAIHVKAEQHLDEVKICIVDNGIGIDPDKIPQLFELFSQIDSTLERSNGGLGIGLALVKRLVELHGGSVAARSEGLGKGATFTVRLPRHGTE